MVDEKERDEEPSFEDQVAAAGEKAWRQSLLGLAVLVVTIVLFVATLGGIAKAYQSSQDTTSKNPTHRINETLSAIRQARKTAEEQYSEYHEMMDDESIHNINNKFSLLYAAALESEEDYRDFLLNYKSAIFNVAARVPGSGAWHRHYARGLEGFINDSRYREQKSGLQEAVERRRESP